MNAITNLEQAKGIISSLQSALDRERKQLNIARAIIFDLTYGSVPEPSDAVLKARIIMLEQDLKECIEKRQRLKELLNEKL